MLLALVGFAIKIFASDGYLTILEHAFAMSILLVCLVELIFFRPGTTGSFLVVTAIAAMELIAGYVIGIRAARRDLNFG